MRLIAQFHSIRTFMILLIFPISEKKPLRLSFWYLRFFCVTGLLLRKSAMDI